VNIIWQAQTARDDAIGFLSLKTLLDLNIKKPVTTMLVARKILKHPEELYSIARKHPQSVMAEAMILVEFRLGTLGSRIMERIEAVELQARINKTAPGAAEIAYLGYLKLNNELQRSAAIHSGYYDGSYR
jgi:hypothetical protein